MEIHITEPGWYADPTGRHQNRFWTGTGWSRHVDDDGLRSTDAVDATNESGPAYVVAAARVPRPAAPSGRRRRRRNRFVMVAVLLAVCVGIAGGAAAGLILTLDDGDGATTVAEPVDPLVSSLSEYIVESSVGTLTAADAACMTDSIIDTVGRDALVAAGIDRGADPFVALSDDQIRTGLPIALTCLDDATLVALMKQTFSPSMLANLGVSSSACLVDGWMVGVGRDKLTELYSRWAARADFDIATVLDPDQLAAVASVVAECQATSPATTASPTPAP